MVWQATKENSVDHTEDRRGRADAYREGQNCRNGKRWRTSQAAQRVSDISAQGFQPHYGSPLMALLPSLFDAAKRNQRLSSRFLLSHAGRNTEFGLSSNVVAQFFIDFVAARSKNAGAQAAPKIAKCDRHR
jgi:hypothetical protein